MTIDRIVSFLPSATELIYELGIDEKLYGVTHECRYPSEALNKPKVISSVIDSDNLTSNQIDSTTCRLLKEGKDIFILNEKNMIEAEPDLIITQNTCEVCAAHTNQINKAFKILKKKPTLYSMDPHNLREIIESVKELGTILKMEEKANRIAKRLEERIEMIKKIQNPTKPRVLAIEWIDPFFTAGHWVPEMIKLAGGNNLISKTGEHSRKLNFEEISAANPEIIILMPCGFDVKRTLQEYENTLKTSKKWSSLEAVKDKKVFAVDANSYFSKPNIRTITGLEILAKIIQPDKFKKIKLAEESFLRV